MKSSKTIALLPQRLREDLLVFRVMLLKGYTADGCLPQFNPDVHTETVVPLYGLCEGREPKQTLPVKAMKNVGKCEKLKTCLSESVQFIHGL